MARIRIRKKAQSYDEGGQLQGQMDAAEMRQHLASKYQEGFDRGTEVGKNQVEAELSEALGQLQQALADVGFLLVQLDDTEQVLRAVMEERDVARSQRAHLQDLVDKLKDRLKDRGVSVQNPAQAVRRRNKDGSIKSKTKGSASPPVRPGRGRVRAGQESRSEGRTRASAGASRTTATGAETRSLTERARIDRVRRQVQEEGRRTSGRSARSSGEAGGGNAGARRSRGSARTSRNIQARGCDHRRRVNRILQEADDEEGTGE